ncbi:MAG: NAD-dependent epimerase/dehydratase family protein [Phototrophicaceae bacterium]
MQTIFVTGGTGFLGRHLVPKLCQAGFALKILTRTPQKHTWLKQYPNIEVIEGDIEIGTGLEFVEGCDYVVHAAGLFSMWRGAGDFEATNTVGTKNLIKIASQYNVKRFIYVSTIAVIGHPQTNQIIDETHPPRPADLYQSSKLGAEQVIQHHLKDDYHPIEAIILRAGAFYGPLGEYAFNRLFFTDPMRGLIVQPDGGNYLTFPVYIDDVAQGILKSLTKGRSGEIYNICGASITHRVVYDIICKEANLSYPRIYLPNSLGVTGARLLTFLSYITGREPFYPLGLKSYVFNNWSVSSEKAIRELDFVPTDFRIGAKRTIEWYRQGKPEILPEHDCQ